MNSGLTIAGTGGTSGQFCRVSYQTPPPGAGPLAEGTA